MIYSADAQIEKEQINPAQLQKWLDEYWKDKVHWVSLSEAAAERESVSEPPEGWSGSLEGTPSIKKSTKNEVPDGQMADSQRPNPSGSKEQAGIDERADNQKGNDLWNILNDLPKALNQLASSMEAREEESERKNVLQEELKDIPQNKIHAGRRYQFHREIDISENSFRNYHRIAGESRHTAKRLEKLAEEILQRKEGGTLKGLYMGKRLSRGELYRRDGKLFEKKLLPEEEPSLAFAVLVDVSGSMNGERIENARKTALALYWFCEALSIPVLVYGHSTHDTYCFSADEVVDICSYAEFDSIDGNDAVRIAGMETIGCNRDGAALRYVGERLSKREEEVKILILISDGKPNGKGYSGEPARKDLLETKHCLEKRGIHLFAAAIGEDRELIENIYQNGFLNISDLETMPVKLSKLLMAYLR